MLISIIVPVYKVEKYLSKCIDSILSQTFTDFELLLINDGSPDRSGEICDEYAAKDCRIRVFHKSNGGVCSARNVGLDNARGEWIMFVDSDDWVGNTYVENVLEIVKCNDIQIVRFGITKQLQNGKSEVDVPVKTGVFDTTDFFINGIFSAVLFSFAISKSIVEKHKIRFNTQIKYSEDREFITKCVLLTDKIFLSDSTQYNYVFNQYSAVNTKRTYHHCKDDLRVGMSIQKFKTENHIVFEKEVFSFFFSILLNSFIEVLSIKSCKDVDYKDAVREFNIAIKDIDFTFFSIKDRIFFSSFSSHPELVCNYVKYRKVLGNIIRKYIFPLANI